MSASELIRHKGYLGDKPETDSNGTKAWPFTFFTDPPVTAYLAESMLNGAGITLRSGLVIEADIMLDVIDPAAVKLENLSEVGLLPGRDEPLSWA